MDLYNKFLVRVLEGRKICENICNQNIWQIYDVQLATLQLRGKVIFLLNSCLLSSQPHIDYGLCAGRRYILVICDLNFDYYIISMYISGVWAKEINFTVLLENPIDSCI